MSAEDTPLLQDGAGGDTAVTDGELAAPNDASSPLLAAAAASGKVVVRSIDEVPPPAYTSVTGGAPMIACRVCQEMIDISGKRDQHVVKCLKCKEATPIRNAPPGRKYVRCPCNCLLICKTSSQRIACPRVGCKRVISLGPSGPPANAVPDLPGMCRVTCAHCHDSFLFNSLNHALARCPHCRKISSVGGDFRKKRGLLLCILGFMMLIVAIGVTAGTLDSASMNAGLYLLYIGLFVSTAFLLWRGIYYMTMRMSFVEGSASPS